MEIYPRYKNARDTAWKILIKYKLVNFPLDIFELINKLKIKLYDYNKVKEFFKIPNNVFAFSFLDGKTKAIIYQTEIYNPRFRFSLAHEVGHLVLNHFDKEIIRDDFTESEANIFARCLLMPAIVCHVEKLHTTEQIQSFFNVSKQAAEIRLKRVLELEKRNAWNYSPLEQKYYKMYTKEFIY